MNLCKHQVNFRAGALTSHSWVNSGMHSHAPLLPAVYIWPVLQPAVWKYPASFRLTQLSPIIASEVHACRFISIVKLKDELPGRKGIGFSWCCSILWNNFGFTWMDSRGKSAAPGRGKQGLHLNHSGRGPDLLCISLTCTRPCLVCPSKESAW